MAAIAVLSSPAVAHNHGGGGGKVSDKPWDTDNLRFGNYSAKSLAIPHYGSQGVRSGTRTVTGYLGNAVTLTENHSPCQPSVMDGFFQNSASQPRNDLPVLEKTDDGWKETTGHNCDSFVTS